MKLSELIVALQEIMELNGDMDVVGIRNGVIYEEIEINCPYSDSPEMYLELYRRDDL